MVKYEKEYSESTLMSMNKKWLVEYIQCLVHNNNVLHERINNQANYLKELQRLCGDKFLCHMNCIHRGVDRRVGEERKNERNLRK